MNNLTKITDYLWEIPHETNPEMNVPARVYATEDMLELVINDRSLWQLSNVASMPGLVGQVSVMPDVHEGYGFPIGAVAASDAEEGIISPGGIGYDINCGVRLLRSGLSENDIKGRAEKLAEEIYKQVPSGVGRGGQVVLNLKEIDRVLNGGSRWALNEGFATENDLRFTESYGCLESADASAVSEHAKNRGNDQLGTMGAGNHFVEVDIIREIPDEAAAEVFGLRKGQVVVLIHTGSRGLGHQVATDYVKMMLANVKKYGIHLRDRELSCVPFKSGEGQQYFAAMSAAANYAWTNRQIITHEVREAWRNIFGKSHHLELVYDVAHNIAKIEEHTVGGKKLKTVVHRKGSTRAFPKGHPEVPDKYRRIGQPVLIPGSMGTSSYVLAGLPEAMELSFGSACHGAGRAMSRKAAKSRMDGAEILAGLNSRGIAVQAGSVKGVAEEAPGAYKDVETVVDVVEKAGIAKKVARMEPIAVIKG